MKETNQYTAFAKGFFERCFILRDANQVKDCLASDAVWMNADGAVQNREQILQTLEEEKSRWKTDFLLESFICETFELAPGIYNLFGSLVLRENSGQELALRVGVQFVMNCGERDGCILVRQLQVLMNDRMPDCDGKLPWNVAKDYYKSIQEQLEEKTGELHRQNEELRVLLQNIPGGVVRVLNNKNFTIRRMYDGLASMLGYTDQEVEDQLENKYINLIHPDDRSWVTQQLRSGLSHAKTYEIIYRGQCKDGKLIWMLEKGQLMTDESGEENFYCVVLDVTDTILAQEALQISEERYRIISEQSNDIIFEINLGEMTLGNLALFEKKFGYAPNMKNFPHSLVEDGVIHPDDVGLARIAYNNLCIGEGRLQSEMRLRKNEDSYIWCSIQMTTIFDPNHKPVKIIGKLVDIDEQKKEKERLIEKARRDQLTGLYNKMTAQAMMKQCIADSGPYQQHVLMVIDVDNFKGINDSLGHQIGDTVLHEIAIKMQRLFCDGEILGRIGGDEFVVLIHDVPDICVAEQKAWEVCRVFRSLSFGSHITAMISGSVGIACYPKDGVTYTQLFKKADEALYYAKGHGRDCYCMYDTQCNKRQLQGQDKKTGRAVE